MKVSTNSSGIMSRVLAILVTGLLATQIMFGQVPWYNADWQFRVPVTVTNANTEALAGFQIQITFTGSSFTWGQANSDGSDIVFTDISGTTLLPFWIETWDPSGQQASIWVKATSLPVGTTTIYMYYGNSEAGSLSNASNTFDFYDDFSDETINTSKWEVVTGDFSIEGGSLRFQGTLFGDRIRARKDGANFIFTNGIIECSLRGNGGTNEFGPMYRGSDPESSNGYMIHPTTHNSANLWRIMRRISGVSSGPITSGGTFAVDTWYRLRAEINNTSHSLYIDESLIGSTVTDGTFSTGTVGLLAWGSATSWIDDFRIRKYASAVPAFQLESVQTRPPSFLTLTLTKTDLVCNGSHDGSINCEVTGGTEPYSYLWSGPGGFSSTDPNISGLVAGTYSVLVTDVNSISGYQSVTVNQPDPLIVSYSVTTPFDCNTGTTVINISATGGTPGYDGTGTRTQSLGTIVYYVSDANNCSASISVTVSPDGSWFGPDWLYRKSIEVINTSGSSLTDFQVEVNLDGTFDYDLAKDDGSDVRFTMVDGTTLIPYWIESWDKTGGQAKIWVRVPSIPVPGSDIYMYYGNAAATAESNPDNTFEFFDDFNVPVTQQPGYYEFEPAINNLVPITWEYNIAGDGGVAHTLSVVKAPAGAGYTYYGYYGPQGSGYVAIAGSNDLVTWTKFPYNQNSESGPVNPIAMGGGERWPSVYLNEAEGIYYMVHTMNYGASYIVYRTSTDGLTWSAPVTVVPYVQSNQNPSLFHDNSTGNPYSGHYFLYWLRFVNGHTIMYREATTVAGLATAEDHVLLEAPGEVLAAPQTLLYDGTYFLSTEIIPSGTWQVRMYSSTSPRGPFTVLPGNPVLADGCACMFQHLFNGSIYEYYCKQTSGTWTLDMRVVDPTTGRIVYEQAEINPTKWTADGGTWTIQTATQPDGSTGSVAQGITSTNQILKSTYSGNDYVLEGFGRQITDRVWGLGARVTDRRNLYSLNLYEDIDEEDNLYFYNWQNGTASILFREGMGPVNLATWAKLTIKAHGSTFDLYLNDDLKGTVTDETYQTGSVALYGEVGVTAQFDDIRVRKYASAEPVTSLRSIEESPGQWTGTENSDWNNSLNWTDGIPGPCSLIRITGTPLNQPIITSTEHQQVFSLMIAAGASLTLDEGSALTVGGNVVTNGDLNINSAPYSEPNGLISTGSLIVKGSSTGNVSFNRYLRPDDQTGDKHLFSSPVGGQNIPEFRKTYTDEIDYLRTWDEFGGVWSEVVADNFISGKGYNVYQKTNSDGLFSFTGSVVNSASIQATSPFEDPYLSRGTDPYGNTDPTTISWTDGRGYISGSWANWGGGGWNLLGNPFTSAMDASIFITTNSGSLDPYYQAIYVYDGVNAAYQYYAVPISGFDPFVTPGGSRGSIIQAGQGFMVMANYDDAPISFTPEMRTHSTGTVLLKSAAEEDPWPGLQLKVKQGDKESLTTIVYNNEMSTGLDPGYDLGQLASGRPVEIYTILAAKDEGVNLARQALPVAGADTIVVSVGIDSETGGEVTFSAYTVPLGTNKFWLEDRLTGIFTDLARNAYTVTLPAKTYGTGRFYLKSASTATSIETPDPEPGLRIWTSNGKVIIKGEVSEQARCEVYYVNGGKILDMRLTGGELNTIDLPGGSKGMLIVRVVDGAKATTRKVALL